MFGVKYNMVLHIKTIFFYFIWKYFFYAPYIIAEIVRNNLNNNQIYKWNKAQNKMSSNQLSI